VIHNYYITGGALTVCTACMIRIADINDGIGMYHIREHETGSFSRLDGKSCRIAEDLCTVYFRAACAHSAH